MTAAAALSLVMIASPFVPMVDQGVIVLSVDSSITPLYPHGGRQ